MATLIVRVTIKIRAVLILSPSVGVGVGWSGEGEGAKINKKRTKENTPSFEHCTALTPDMGEGVLPSTAEEAGGNVVDGNFVLVAHSPRCGEGIVDKGEVVKAKEGGGFGVKEGFRDRREGHKRERLTGVGVLRQEGVHFAAQLVTDFVAISVENDGLVGC